MLQKIFYVTGIAVNIGIIITLLNFNKKEEVIENLPNKEIIEENREEVIEERLRKINLDRCNLKNWLNYIPGLSGKNQ